MKSRRSILVLGIVIALMLSVISVASADGPKKQKANFDAFAPIQFVGPGELIGLGATSTELLKIKMRKGKKKIEELGAIQKIVIETKNEGVVATPTFVTGCRPDPDGPACKATTTLLSNAANISLHTSTAKLTKVRTISTTAPDALLDFWQFAPPLGLGLGVLADTTLDVYSGKLKGSLESTFSILNPSPPDDPDTVLVGSARLKINRGGKAVYGCFTDNPDFTLGVDDPKDVPPFLPLPGILFCSTDNPIPPEFGLRTLFLPTFLDIVDHGRFQIVPPEGGDAVINLATGLPVEVDGLILKKLTGRLKVRVLAVNGELINEDPGNPLNRVEIHPGKAVWLGPTGGG